MLAPRIALLAVAVALLLPGTALAAEPSKSPFGVLRRLQTPPTEQSPPGAPPSQTPTLVAAVTPSPSPSPTAEPSATATAIVYPSFAPTHGAIKGRVQGTRLLLEVPIRSQFDGSEYQDSNCGPTALAMVLDAFAVRVRTPLLRNYANRLQGTTDPETGIALDFLSEIADEAGLRPLGLRRPGGYNAWTINQVRAEVSQGHPVITLVKMRLLPYFASSRSDADHYVVVVGLDGGSLLINDPALPADAGFRRLVTPAELEAAWKASSIPAQAVAIAAGQGVPELNLPPPTPVPPTPPASSLIAGREIVPDADPSSGRPLWPEPAWTIERAAFELYNAPPQPASVDAPDPASLCFPAGPNEQ
ncbi:MAG TPA: C39 family peptidase [Chloroflexota bacterium]